MTNVFALVHDGQVQAIGDTDAEWPSNLFDVRAVSDVEGIAPGWMVSADGKYSPPPHEARIVPDRCSKLGLKRALAETGNRAVFEEPEWSAVKAALAADPDLQEDWDLATEIHRADPLTGAMIAARGYSPAQVVALLIRANELVG